MKIKALLYCTKEKNKYDRLVRDEHYGKPFYLYGAITENFESLNGKIACECEVETEEIELLSCLVDSVMNDKNGEINIDDFLKHSCLNFSQLEKYLKYVAKDKDMSTQVGYALHISNVKAFYYPMKLYNLYTRKWIKDEDMYSNESCDSCYSGVCKDCDNHYDLKDVTKPKSIMRVFMSSKEYLLISASPEELCNILNGQADILVRRKVLKGMVD